MYFISVKNKCTQLHTHIHTLSEGNQHQNVNKGMRWENSDFCFDLYAFLNFWVFSINYALFSLQKYCVVIKMIKLVNKIKLTGVSRLRVQPTMSPFSTSPLLTVPKRENKKTTLARTEPVTFPTQFWNWAKSLRNTGIKEIHQTWEPEPNTRLMSNSGLCLTQNSNIQRTLSPAPK